MGSQGAASEVYVALGDSISIDLYAGGPERRTKEAWPHAARAVDYVRDGCGSTGTRDRSITMVAVTPAVHADLMVLPHSPLEQMLPAGDPLAQHVERRACAVTLEGVQNGARDRSRTVVERQRDGQPATVAMHDCLQHRASLASAKQTMSVSGVL
jgi:hypothetical protein